MIFYDPLLFLIGSALLMFISRRNLCAVRSHGFYRFLAWECMLLLLLHQYPFWFVDRFAWYQCLSWLLLFCSIPVVICAVHCLKQSATDQQKRTDTSLLAFEKTTQLITHGIYRHLRHPMYSSLLLLNWGLLFKQPFSLLSIALALLATVLLALTARQEEQENLAYFGTAYRDYMQRSQRFLPWLW